MKVFVNDPTDLGLNTGIDTTTFGTKRIKYKDPDGNEGRWVAAIDPADNNKIRADVQFTSAGRWKVQAFIYKSATEWYHGYWAELRVYQPLATTTTTAPTTAPPTTVAP